MFHGQYILALNLVKADQISGIGTKFRTEHIPYLKENMLLTFGGSH